MPLPTSFIDRRRMLQSMALAGISPLLPTPLLAAVSSAFVTASDPFPKDPFCTPTQPIPPPAGAIAPTFDIFGNHWCLAQPDPQSNRALLVLPAQAPGQWLEDRISALPAHPWRFTAADEFGYLWIASDTRCMRLDPHTPDAGWTEFTGDILSSPRERITAMGLCAGGAAILALDSGTLVEIDRTTETVVKRTSAPAGVDRIACDAAGTLWLACGNKVLSQTCERSAWQRQWELVDRLPAGDHDLSGDVLNGRFYMAGGQNAGWGYPARPHVFRELFEFDPALKKWRIAALLDQPRFYNGTSFLDDRVWIVGGYTRDAIGNAVLLSSVQIFDPATGAMVAGPPLPIPVDNPVALHLDGRIYVAGFQSILNSERPCYLLSIGSGETTWRREPDGPAYLIALAGTVHDGNLYLALPEKGLARFNAKQRAWSIVAYPHSARSPQLATYEDEIWVMGGRGIEHQDRTVIYRPKDNSWRNGPDLPRPLAWGAASTVGGHLMVVGGAAGRGYNNRTFILRKQLLT